MKPGIKIYQCFVLLFMLLHATAIQAQLTTGGDVAGGYLWIDPHMLDDRLNHLEGNGNLWLGYKAKNYDWRLSLTGKYKDVDGEKEVFDIDLEVGDDPTLTTTSTDTNEKPFNLTARYDFNWRRPDKSAYSLWTLYDYEHRDYENSSLGEVSYMSSTEMFFGRIQQKKDVSHRMSVGYHGTTQLNAPGWVLSSNADVSLLKRKVNDAWRLYNQYVGYFDDTPPDTLGWEMIPDYTDYAVNAGLELTDTVYSRQTSRLVLGGGLRFKGEGERFLHEAEMGNDLEDAQSEKQEATGFRFFVEPFLSASWRSGKWSVNAEYGLRLYHMNTTENTGHAAQLYRYLDMGVEPLTGSSFSHFTPLVNGRAKLTYTFSKHHSLSLANSISNRLPSNQQAVLCYVQTDEFNKVFLGNPDLKPEVRILFTLDHTLTYGPFSATTGVSAERTNDLMESSLFRSKVGSRVVTTRTMQNDADASIYKLSETLVWNNKWLKASATIWKHWAHHQGIGSIRGGREVDDQNWGWNLNARADFGQGWAMATNFSFVGENKTIASQTNRMWQSSTVSIEKRFGPVTLYLNASRLVDPSYQIKRYNSDGDEIYNNIIRSNNRIVMLGCRWSL